MPEDVLDNLVDVRYWAMVHGSQRIVNAREPAALRLVLVDLDQQALVVDAHQLAVQPALDVMVRMHVDGAPVGDPVGHAVQGEQGMTLLLLED